MLTFSSILSFMCGLIEIGLVLSIVAGIPFTVGYIIGRYNAKKSKDE